MDNPPRGTRAGVQINRTTLKRLKKYGGESDSFDTLVLNVLDLAQVFEGTFGIHMLQDGRWHISGIFDELKQAEAGVAVLATAMQKAISDNGEPDHPKATVESINCKQVQPASVMWPGYKPAPKRKK